MNGTGPGQAVVGNARAALAQGDLIATYDLARTGLANGEAGAAYLVVLSLARMGDTAAAQACYVELGLDRARDVDSRALGARLAKNSAEELRGDPQRAAFAAASRLYAAIHDDTGELFPGINAASTAYLSGDVAAARQRAEALLRASGEVRHYWTGATRAEALVLLGRDEAAAAACMAARGLPGDDLGARATTLCQLEMLAALAGLDADGQVRAVLQPPGLAIFCGHMFVERTAAEAALTARVAAALADGNIRIGFGALACGADIVVAEQLLARGGELNAVLPFPVADFVRSSVAPGGPGWQSRFEACLAAAHAVHIVSEIGDIGDPRAFNHGTATAMGLARLRAAQLGGTATMLAVCDENRASAQACVAGVAGTSVDVACWRAAGGRADLIAPGAIDRAIAPAARAASYAGPPRLPMALIFADAPSFSKLAEQDIPAFWREVMGTASAVLGGFQAAVRSRNSWGDALFIVVDDVAAAAGIMLALQEALAAAGAQFTLRIGGHYGMVFETDDPVTGQPTYYGTEVSRTARIEPVTPPGQSYVTASFAAALTMAPGHQFRCHYVGRVPLAKDYGTFPMYRLSRGHAGMFKCD